MAATRRPVTAEDLLRFQFVGDAQVSPDGSKAVYVVTKVDGEKDGYSSAIWITDLEGAGKPLTAPWEGERLIRDHSPRWSPDGERIAFVSNRTGTNQVWVMAVSGGEAKQVTKMATGVESIEWSPDGTRIAFLAEEPKAADPNASDVRVITTLRYKQDSRGFRGYNRNHIWVADAETGKTKQITSGDWEDIDPSWSPDGKSIVFVSARDERRDIEHIPGVWKADVETGECTLLASGRGFTTTPVYSPDGRWIAYFDHTQGETSAGNDTVWVIPAEGGQPRKLAKVFDRSAVNWIGTDVKWNGGPHCPVWSADQQYIYFLATDGGNCHMYRVGFASGEVEPVVCGDAQVVGSFTIDRNRTGTIVYIASHPHSCGDVYVRELGVSGPGRQLTDFNRAFYDETYWSTPERFTFRGSDDWEIEGWILKPYGFEAGKRYPLVLQIHGGPHTTYGNALHHEFQMLASAGYAVMYTNPRGSQGYGEKFVRAVMGDWGGKDYEDLMKATDYACTLDYVDESRLFVCGGSYGGYMVNWIVGQTDRFRAAVTQRSICNLHSMFGTSDIGFYFNYAELGDKDIWEHEQFILERSPIRYAPNVKTPTLIEHSEYDLRCPMEQAEQWYMALKRFGVDTELVITPNEGHELSRSGTPKHRIARLRHILKWFERYRDTE